MSNLLIRTITNEEVEWCIDFITPNKGIPLVIAQSLQHRQKEQFRVQLHNIRIIPEILPKLKDRLKRYHYSAIIQPGEAVGVLCGQSTGEKGTQSTLNTFHKAGENEESVTVGVPKFQELLAATKVDYRRSVMTVMLNGPYHQGENSLKREIGVHIRVVNLLDDIYFSDKWTECWDMWDKLWGLSYCTNYTETPPNGTKFICCQLDPGKVHAHHTSVREVSTCINEELGEQCTFWDEYRQRIWITSSVTFQELEQTTIYGRETISKVIGINFNQPSTVITTLGTDLTYVLSLPFVDEFKTVSDNIWEIYSIFGIESARECLLIQMNDIMSGLKEHHILLLVDKITRNGTISSISRYTMRDGKIGVLAKASFEETFDNFIKASVNEEVDPVRSVSASIMCGKRSYTGTGLVDLFVNPNTFN